MNKRVYLISAGILFGALMAFFALRPKPTTAQSLDTVFSSPINGGCYIAAPNQCKIHIDPFTINHNTTLMQFTMYANGSPIYDFRTDVSNPPSVNYSPSLVALDFAATCGESYVVNMTARAIDNPSPLNAGQTTEFTCPAGVP